LPNVLCDDVLGAASWSNFAEIREIAIEPHLMPRSVVSRFFGNGLELDSLSFADIAPILLHNCEMRKFSKWLRETLLSKIDELHFRNGSFGMAVPSCYMRHLAQHCAQINSWASSSCSGQ
jgi:hypothetical protein